MTPGVYSYNVVHANQFILTATNEEGKTIYQKVLSGAGRPPKRMLSSWDWSYTPSDANYHGLYPRSWYTYNIPELNLKLICKQISPVIPHNYQVSKALLTLFRNHYNAFIMTDVIKYFVPGFMLSISRFCLGG